MKLNEINVGDCIRITYGKEFIKEGTVITKTSNGIAVQTDVNHQMFFPKEFFTENVNIEILQKNTDEVIVEEIVKIKPSEAFDKLQLKDLILLDGGLYIVSNMTYGHLRMDEYARPYCSCYMHWKRFNENTEVSVIQKVT